MVLQGAGDDFRGRGGTAVDQHYQRRVAKQGARGGTELHLGVTDAALGVDDQALVEEGVGDFHRGVEHAAGVVAQVQHQTLELAVVLFLQFVDGVGQILAGVGLEVGDAQIAEAILETAVAHALYLDDVAGNGDLEGPFLAFTDDGEGDVGAHLAAHDVDRFTQGHALDGLLVETDDQVAGLHAGALGRGIVDGGDDLDEAVFHADFDAEAAEFAAGAHLQILEAVGVEIAGMGVEAGEHAADGIFQQLLVADGFHVVLLDAGEDLGKGAQLVEGQRRCSVLRLFFFRQHALADGQHDAKGKTDEEHQQGAGIRFHV